MPTPPPPARAFVASPPVLRPAASPGAAVAAATGRLLAPVRLAGRARRRRSRRLAPRTGVTAAIDPVTEEHFAECAAYTPTPNVPYLLEDGERVVRLEPPLGVELKETASGAVYVVSVVPGGAADASGEVPPGSVITGCSVPYGDALCGLPKTEGVDFVAGQLESRGEREGYFLLSLFYRGPAVDAVAAEVEAEEATATKTSIEWQPLMARMKGRDHYELLSEEARAEMEAEDARARKAEMASWRPAAVREGEGGDDDDPLYYVDPELEQRSEKRMRELRRKMEEQEGAV
jgi:hypothetical protein